MDRCISEFEGVWFSKSDLNKSVKNFEKWCKDNSKEDFQNFCVLETILKLTNSRLEPKKKVIYLFCLCVRKQYWDLPFVLVKEKDVITNQNDIRKIAKNLDLDFNLIVFSCRLFENDDEILLIDSVSTLLSQLEVVGKKMTTNEEETDNKQNSGSGKDIFRVFRGHGDFKYMEKPGVFRVQNGINYIDYEKKLYNEFLIRKPIELINCHTILERLSLMQHYGLPTRILDLTTNPLVALYFACFDSLNSIGELLVYKEYRSNIKYGDSHKVKIASAMALLNNDEKTKFLCEGKTDQIVNRIRNEEPGFLDDIDPEHVNEVYFVKVNYVDNPRIQSQSGMYAIGANHIEFEKMIKKKRPMNVMLLILPSDKKTILKELDLFGINKFTVYLSLRDTAEYLKDNISIL